MKILRTKKALLKWRRSVRDLGLVPTMGALHEGHLSLVRQSQRQHAKTLVTIFVNPTQFGPTEDYLKYPRPLKKDVALLKAAGVDAVFCPSVDEMYEGSSETRVHPDPHLNTILEGPRRPGHFAGVATVVTKFFCLTGADAAFFGEKDFQQVRVVEQMVKDLCLPIKIVRVPTLREKSGLALSSRNQYLSPDRRNAAAALYQTLSSVASLKEVCRRLSRLRFKVEYVEDWEIDLRRRRKKTDQRFRRLAAVKFEGVRLIDNLLLKANDFRKRVGS